MFVFIIIIVSSCVRRNDDDGDCAVLMIAEKVSYHRIALSLITSEAIGADSGQ